MKSPLLLFFLVVNFHVIFVASQARLNFPRGLENDDIIEWSGRVSSRKSTANLVIKPRMTRPNTKHFRLEVQGFRNRVVISNTPTSVPYKYRICFLGKKNIKPSINFNFQIRVSSRVYRVFLNRKLIFSLPNSVAPEAVRLIQVFGSATETTLKKLTVADFAERLNSNNCGVTTNVEDQLKYESKCNEIHNDKGGVRIVNGKVVFPGLLPWQASIRRKAEFANGAPHLCGATLIHKCWAISAGHCFPVVHTSSIKRLEIRVGDYFNDDSSSFNSFFAKVENTQDMNIAKVYKHELYQSQPTARFDIALIRLQTCARLGPFVKPICLPTSLNQFETGAQCVISGWGASEWSQAQANHPKCLMFGNIRIIDENDCRTTFATKRYDSNIMMCGSGITGSAESSVDACQGDSGGPMVCGPAGGPSTLFGVTSWGIRCGDSEYPGVYTRLSAFMKWIYRKVVLEPNDDQLRRLISRGDYAGEYCQHKRS